MSEEVKLSLKEGVMMQKELIKLYIGEEFQRRIWAEFDKAGDDALKQMQAKAECCQEVQFQVVPKFGFEASRQGVQASLKAFTPEMNFHPDIVEKNQLMQFLIDPKVQQDAANKGTAPPAGFPPSRARAPRPERWPRESGKIWRVTGGKREGGIVVRKEVDVRSAEYVKRLSHHALIEQVELDGDRLRYKRSSGTGPETGWVSVMFRGKPILQPYYFDLDFAEVIPESWKVVNERVAKRAEPSKDALMVGGGKMGDILKGWPMDQNGVQWLQCTEEDPQNKGLKMQVFVMIDGTSLGLGILLEKM